MMFKKKTGKVSKTFLASMVIFNLVFTTAALPVVSLAYEGDAPASVSRDASSSAGRVEKGEIGKGGKDGSGNGRTKPGDGSGNGGSSKSGSTSFNPHRAQKGEVKGEETSSCDVGNLIVNGSFENPDVNNIADWNVYPDGTSGLGWNVAWNGTFVGAPKTANMEIQNGVNGWNAYLGTQYTELDSDWGGPSDPMSGEQASAVISQTIDTVPGNTYSLHFAFAARPGTVAGDNKLGIYIDDGVFDLSTTSSFGEYHSDQPYWIVRDFEFTASKEHTKIAFADIGTPNSVGSFLDDVRVNCLHEGNNGCPANNMIYARLKLTPQPYGWRNWGNGNTSGNIFVGGNSNSNIYQTNEWFPLTNPDGSFIEDADISTYRDVPGLALQRSEGKVRIVLYGYLYNEVKPGNISPDRSGSSATVRNYYFINRELSQGSLEFSTDKINRSTTVTPTSQMSDPVNPLDFTSGVHQYHPGSDSLRIISNLSQWHMLVTTGSDGFYTYYTNNNKDEGDCDGEGKTGSLTVNKVIEGQGNGTFHFNGPNGTFDITTANGAGATQINNLDEGNYSVTEIPMAGWHVVSSTCTNVPVAKDNASECTIINAMDSGTGCDTEKNDCPDEGACSSGAIWARVNVEDFYNLGTGDVTSNVYLGSDSNVIASGQWFMVYDGANFINDADISGYEDVKGLAVQRMNGKIRVLLHGSSVPTPNHKEFIEGNVEFFNGLVNAVTNDSSGNNTLENGTNGALDVISYAGDRAYFEIQVDQADDAFFAKYEYSLDEDCGNDGGDENPGIEVGDRCVLFGTDFPMDRITITNNDGTLDQTNLTIFDLSTFHADIPGSYPLTVTLKDDEGNILSGPTVYTFTVAPEGDKDCGNGGGGDDNCDATLVTQIYVSDETTTVDGHNAASITTPINSAWTASILGAGWIWSEADVTDATIDITKTFTKTFSISGTPSDVNLEIAADNSYKIFVNGTELFADSSEFNYRAEGQDTYVIPVANLVTGLNTITFEVKNWGLFGHTPQTNPAGLMYKFTVNDCRDNGGGGCTGPDCPGDDDNGGNGGGGGGGGGSSSGSRGGRNRGEVLGAETGSCVAFVQYNDTGSTKSEVKALQTFLNEYMDAGLNVSGTYDRATTQAVHDFQAMHWDDIIDPWTPPLSPNTTGREYKTTRATINAIMDCPEAPVYLEDPQTMFSITEVKNQKTFTQSQIDKVTELLLEAHSGEVMGAVDAK